MPLEQGEKMLEPVSVHMQRVDWSVSPLGLPESWTTSLRNTCAMLQRTHAQVVLFWGPELVALYNDAYAPTIGDKHPRALGRPAHENWAELWDDLGPLLRGVMATGETFSSKDRPFYIERHGYGETVYFDVSYSAVPDDDGSIGGVLCIVSETTERVMAYQRLQDSEAALQASEAEARKAAEELAAIYQAAPIGLAFLDTDLRYVQINERLAEWNGFSAHEHIGKSVAELLPDMNEQMLGLFNKVLQGEPRWGQEIVGGTPGRPDPQSTWRENWVPMRGRDGKIAGIAVSCEDVTDERRAHRAVATLNRVGIALAGVHELEDLVQMVTDAGVELSGAGFGAFFYNVLDAAGESYMLYSLSGAPREAFEGFPMPRNTQVFAPTFNGEGIVRSDDITRDPRYGHNVPRHGMPEGHLPVRSYLAAPVISRDGEVLGGLFFGHPEPGRFGEHHERLVEGLAAQAGVAIENARLIQRVQEANETLEKRVAQRTAELTEAHEALRQSQKMEAIGQLTGGVAHDFNNLLTPIVGSLDLLRHRLAEDARSVRLLDGALESAQRAATLVQRLLAFARRQPLQPTAVDMKALVNGMAGLITSTLGPQIRVTVEAPDDLRHALADQNQVEMALLNLGVNARDAMPGGGALHIDLAELEADGSEPDLEAGRYVRLAVTDTGSGMDGKTLERAIEPFFSTKQLGQGTGLGLSMVHGLASQLGGVLRLESELGKGTRAELWLPACEGKAPVARNEANPRLAQAQGKVLLVDDEPHVRTTTATMLRDMGYEVSEAASGPEALQLLVTGPAPDVLLSDHLMPGLTGTDLARQVRDRNPETRIIIMSGFAEVEALSGEFAYLPKPFRRSDLARLLVES